MLYTGGIFSIYSRLISICRRVKLATLREAKRLHCEEKEYFTALCTWVLGHLFSLPLTLTLFRSPSIFYISMLINNTSICMYVCCTWEPPSLLDWSLCRGVKLAILKEAKQDCIVRKRSTIPLSALGCKVHSSFGFRYSWSFVFASGHRANPHKSLRRLCERNGAMWFSRPTPSTHTQFWCCPCTFEFSSQTVVPGVY